MRALPTLFLFVPLLGACDQINSVKETLDGWTNPLVAQGLVLGVAEPDIDGFDLSKTDLKDGAAATLFLADAASVDDMEDAPISGADVKLQSDSNGKLALAEEGSGQYVATGSDGLKYAAGELATILVNLGDSAASVSTTTPPAPEADIDETHTVNTGMTLDLSGQGYDAALAVIFDASTGDITFSNQPESIKEVYEFTHGDGESLVIDVPASAFADRTVYAVGVAGLISADSGDFVDMNTALSGFMAGKMRFYPVSTAGAR